MVDVPVTKQKQREGEHEIKGGRFAQKVHLWWRVAISPQDDHCHSKEQFTGNKQSTNPERQDSSPGETDQSRGDVQAVCSWVENPPQGRYLIPAACQLSIQIVRDATERKNDQGPAIMPWTVEFRP